MQRAGVFFERPMQKSFRMGRSINLELALKKMNCQLITFNYTLLVEQRKIKKGQIDKQMFKYSSFHQIKKGRSGVRFAHKREIKEEIEN